MPTWPLTLPQKPLTEGYREAPVAGAIRSPMEMGPAKQRRRFTGNLITITCVFDLTVAQKATLDTFWFTTLGCGAAAFDWAHPVSGAVVSARFVADQPPTIVAKDASLFFVECQLEVTPTAF